MVTNFFSHKKGLLLFLGNIAYKRCKYGKLFVKTGVNICHFQFSFGVFSKLGVTLTNDRFETKVVVSKCQNGKTIPTLVIRIKISVASIFPGECPAEPLFLLSAVPCQAANSQRLQI